MILLILFHFQSALGERLGFGHRVHLLRRLFAQYFAEDEEQSENTQPESNPQRVPDTDSEEGTVYEAGSVGFITCTEMCAKWF